MDWFSPLGTDGSVFTVVESVCADVRPVLREVFRELDCLPPLALADAGRRRSSDLADGDNSLPKVEPWGPKYTSECKDLWLREGELKQQHAKRISREPLPNLYKLYPLKQTLSKTPSWKTEKGILQRNDLMPTIVQNAAGDESLWVKNILTTSSGDLSTVEVRGSKLWPPVQLSSPEDASYKSVSMGDIVVRPPPPAPPVLPPPPLPEHIICVPPQLDFVNFTIGKLQSQSIRLVNVSKFEYRLSLRPPRRRELDVELCAPRGLLLSSGADAEIKVHFRARDVRVLRDVLQVRVRGGRALLVPICCYMEPPLLDIVVAAVPASLPSWSLEEAVEGGARGARGGEVLELGARLLGDVHAVSVLLRCPSAHAAFFLITEDAWIDFCLDALSSHGSLIASPFAVCPAWWRGGGAVRARAWCRAPCVGLHAAALRVLASTAVVRPLHIIADSLYYQPDHVTVEAHEKDYDICSEDDPDCNAYVHLGTAFPNQSLSATVQLINHSPMIYSYYWTVRPWGVCSCWEDQKAASKNFNALEVDSETLCLGAKEARDMELQGLAGGAAWRGAARARVAPERGSLAPRSSLALHVSAPDVGRTLGTQRAVLMLILKDVPKESFSSDFEPAIVKTDVVESEPIPGVTGWTREVCEVVCAQMEVWWEVAPIRFVLDPPVLPLTHSRRVQSVDIQVRATQLFGCESIRGHWLVPRRVPPPPPADLTALHSCDLLVHCPLPALPNQFAETDVITLKSAEGEWASSCTITRQCATRHPSLSPALVWLGVVPPGAAMRADLTVLNDTHQHICWWATPFRWAGENAPAPACLGRAPCAACRERNCSCALLRNSRGALAHDASATIYYNVNAPEVDGCVATLVQTRRTSADVCRVADGAGVEARATLLNYRVLAPRLVLRVLPCHGNKRRDCEGCALDEGSLGSPHGTATLRPSEALVLRRLTCCRLRVTNITPIPTSLVWDEPLEADILNVIFFPNEMEVKGYGEVEFQVVLDPRRVCGRRLFVHRAVVRHAYLPSYLIIDTAIAGLEILCEVPIGDQMQTDTTLIMRRTQREDFPWDADKFMPSTFQEMFEEEDRKRAVRAENICSCHFEMQYIPPVKRPMPPTEEQSPIEIVWEPPALTRVCACFGTTKPTLPEHPHPCVLQLRDMPLRTVCTRTVRLRNESVLTANWRTAVRRWPRRRTRKLGTDGWAQDVQDPGLVMQCSPSAGELGPRACAEIRVQLYADCWGLYRDQLLIKVDRLEALVLDVWTEARGAPLLLALDLHAVPDQPLTLWLTGSDAARTLRVKNNSRTPLLVHAYLLLEHEHEQARLPFRLYLRCVDELPRACPCVRARPPDSFLEGESIKSSTTYEEEMDTGFELFLAPDCGRQENTYFEVSPDSTTVPAGAWAEWRVSLRAPPHREGAPPSALLLRPLPLLNHGWGWCRPDPPPQLVRLRQARRAGRLRASVQDLRVHLCALDLPFDDVIRVRKHFRIQNIGCGVLEMSARCRAPWALLDAAPRGHERCCGAACPCGGGAGAGAGAGAGGTADLPRDTQRDLSLLPRSSLEMCVEARVRTTDAWPVPATPPSPAPPYEPWRRTVTKLRFYDDYNVLLTIPLHLELEYPVITIEPALLDFGFVTDGDTRKSYFTVSHSSRTATVAVVSQWVGAPHFRLWPRDFSLQPGGSERLYILYTAKWCGAPVEGGAQVSAACGARAWCRATGRARAAAARGSDRRAHAHDHTDDTHLLPRTDCCPEA